MGYYTEYKLELQSNNPKCNFQDIIQSLRTENDNANYALMSNGEGQEPCKWYEHELELIEFSKYYPDVLFILTGHGEDNEDMWQKKFLDGNCKRLKAIITFQEDEE